MLVNLLKKIKRRFRKITVTETQYAVSAQAGYDIWAKQYDGKWVEKNEKDRLFSMLGDIKGKQICDAGCGNGRNIEKYIRAGAIVSGIDISSEMIAQAQKKLEENNDHASLATGHLAEMPFADAVFDAVVASSSLDHIERLSPVIKQVSRVLKSNGIFIYSGLHPDADFQKYGARFLNQNKMFFLEEYRHSFEELDQLCSSHNLKEVERHELKDDSESEYVYALIKYVKNSAT